MSEFDDSEIKKVLWASLLYKHYFGKHEKDEKIKNYFHYIIDRVRSAVKEDKNLVEILDRIKENSITDEELLEKTGFDKSLTLYLYSKLRLDEEDYFEYILNFKNLNSFYPEYINMGPTGRCNLKCKNCILGGAIFREKNFRLTTFKPIQKILEEMAHLKIRGISLCIGEPTYNMKILMQTLSLASALNIRVRSIVSNALFASSLERSTKFFSDVKKALHLEKPEDLNTLIAVSVNRDLFEQGVTLDHALTFIKGFFEVFPKQKMVVQFINDYDLPEIYQKFINRLRKAGIYAGKDTPDITRGIILEKGGKIIFSVMQKQPSINNPLVSEKPDEYVKYITLSELKNKKLKGIYTFFVPGADGGVESLPVERLTLGPDGVFYPDYHFMVQEVMPLGTTVKDAINTFRSDPILTFLLKDGGINEIFEIYHSIPEDKRPVPEIYSYSTHFSTVSMIAANVFFGNYIFSLFLAKELARHLA